MEKLVGTLFSNLEIPENSKIKVIDKILLISKWNWDYDECLTFQKQSQEFVRNNRDHKIYIFCNHPHLFTLGRGNERGREDLVEFDESEASRLSFPLHKIHRGGGITFHYPGQWIFYPIVSINAKYTLDDHMCWMLKTVKEILRDKYGLEKAMATKKLMGVWFERRKLASIGVGLNRFVTEHGLALNLNYDEKMFNELEKINPCGMDFKTYQALDNLIDKKENLIFEFDKEFKERII